MTNRTLFILTSLVLLGMTILLSLNISSILTGQPENQPYLKYNHVRGIAVGHNQLLYTLNFDQQNRLIDFINKSVKIAEIKSENRQKPNIDKIIVYQFNNKPDLLITPIAYVDENFIFSAPEWFEKGYFMELSEGDLKQLLSQSYDS